MSPVEEPPTDVNTAPPYPGMLRQIRRLIIFFLGTSVLIVGVAMIVLPGPATVVIPAGLAILATEFVWAKRWLDYLKRRAQEVADWTINSKTVQKSEGLVDTAAKRDQT